MKEGTIAAQATPAGRGAIAVVRMSGPDAERILSECFTPAAGKYLEHARLTLGTLNAGSVRDRAMAVLFRAPHSYTGETVAELHLHGSQEIAGRALRHLVSLGARAAEPGEFTRRAFLNGKVGLNEAEAVADLVNAQTAAQINAAYSALKGETASEIRRIHAELAGIIASFDAAIDYPEEDVEEIAVSEAAERTAAVRDALSVLVDSYGAGSKIRSGIRVAIIGEPNAGKSSLMNRLLGRERAIVTAVPGTTRDTIEECFELGGLPFVLVDTAGIRATEDEIESEGIRRALGEAGSADIIIRLAPGGGSRPGAPDGKPVIDVISKCDTGRGDGLNVSSVTGEGVEELKKALLDAAGAGFPAAGGVALTGARQFSLASEALARTEEALCELKSGAPPEGALICLKEALSATAAITGARATEDVLDAVFSKFCVGK